MWLPWEAANVGGLGGLDTYGLAQQGRVDGCEGDWRPPPDDVGLLARTVKVENSQGLRLVLRAIAKHGVILSNGTRHADELNRTKAGTQQGRGQRSCPLKDNRLWSRRFVLELGQQQVVCDGSS